MPQTLEHMQGDAIGDSRRYVPAAGESRAVVDEPRDRLRAVCRIAALAGGDARPSTRSDGVTTYAISMLARSPAGVDHYWYGNLVHDLAGFVPPERVQIDWCHSEELLGYLDRFSVTADGLEVAGFLVARNGDAKAAEIADLARAGVPYEASIDFGTPGCVMEEIPSGAVAEANGRQYAGPGVIFRKWSIAAVAICPRGYDPDTSVALSADGKPRSTVAVERLARGTQTMSAAIAEAAGAAANETEVESTPAASAAAGSGDAATETETETTPAGGSESAAHDAARAELARYIDRFGGEAGARYFADGLDWPAALEKHLAAVTAQLATVQAEAGELRQRLAAVPRGAQPVSAGRESAPRGVESVIRFAGQK